MNAIQHEEEDEEAVEHSRANAVAYDREEHEPVALYVMGLVLIAALAGASLRGRPRVGRREVRIAPATVSTRQRERRLERELRGRRRP